MTTMMMTRMLFGYYYYSLLFICTTSIIIFAINDVVIVAAADAAAAGATTVNREEEILNQNQNLNRQRTQKQRQQEKRRKSRRKPNFVIILADDLDYSLGGINASTLNKTRYYIGGGDSNYNHGQDQDQGNNNGNGNNSSNNKGKGYGKTIHNWLVQTPVCCASRAELLTGKMYHNLKVEQVPQVPPPQAKITTETTPQEHPQQQKQPPHQCMHINVDGTNSSHIFWDHYYFAQYFSNTYSSKSSASGASASESNEESSESESSESESKSESESSESEYNNLDYTIGLFGKHLNTQNPSNFLPKGINEMLINGGGDYVNPSFLHGIRRTGRTGRTNNRTSASEDDNNNDDVKIEEVLFNNCTKTTGYPCYSTSVIGNASLAWIRKQVQVNGNNVEDIDSEDGNNNNEEFEGNTEKTKKPFFALISLKAPHIQDGNGFPVAIPAPWYKDTMIDEMVAPRTPNYNTTGSTVEQPKHWLVRQQTPITQIEELKIDDLYISRLKSLLSVDDLIEELITTLGSTDLNILDNTYIIFTSDNGYRLGQYMIPQCKLHPYENDLRVPFLIRGPGISNNNVNNADNNNADNNDRRQREQQQQTTSSSSSSSSSTEIETESSTMTTTATATADANTNAAVTTSTTLDSPLGAIFSHIHFMPTLLGLATSNYNSQSFLPKTMDGTNLASYVIDYNPTNINDDIDDDQYDDIDSDGDNGRTIIDTNAATAVAAAAFTNDLMIDPVPSNMRNTTMTMMTTTTMNNDTNTSSTDADNIDVVSLLIEYTSLGNVRRYQHLVDTYNHSFIALRIMPKYMALQTTQTLTPQSQTQVRYIKRQQQTLLMHDIKQQQQSQSQQSHNYYLKKKNQKEKNLNLTTTLKTTISRRRQRHRSRVLYNNIKSHTNTTTNTSMKTRDYIQKSSKNNNGNGGMSNNIKYIEFRDSRIDYTNTKTKPLEYELYDLDIDPYELNNIYYTSNDNNDNDHADISLEYKKKLENKIKRLLHCNGQSCRYEHSTGL